MNFIAIEGLDGAGKSTQISMLEQHFKAQGQRVCTLHFPRTDVALWGDMIARFLRGDFGKIGEVNPYLVALLYAEDRRAAAAAINGWLEDGCFVIADRYVYSNIAYQCAKITSVTERYALRNWILNLEYNEFTIPKPQKCLFLDVPTAFTKLTLEQERTGSGREYLQGKQDIHEADISFQKNVREVYLQQSALDVDFQVVSCIDVHTGRMLPREKIFEGILQYILHSHTLQLPTSPPTLLSKVRGVNFCEVEIASLRSQ